MNKKGISPLIGTVLLVAIVIAMILLIMPWMTRTIKEQQEKTTEATRQLDCVTELNFELTSTPGGVMVENRGNLDIVKLVFRRYAPDGSLVDAETEGDGIESIVDAYGIETFSSVICEPGAVEKVQAIATVRSGGKPLTCSENYRELFC